MGFAITWCAVPEAEGDAFLNRLGLLDTGETEEIPESLIGVARLDSGWRLLWYNEYDCPFLGESECREHSKHQTQKGVIPYISMFLTEPSVSKQQLRHCHPFNGLKSTAP